MAKKILIVDDEPDILDLARIRLKRSGYDIVEAPDAEKAMDIIRDTSLDLILLDLLLPNVQGSELCKKLKSDSKYKNIPVILFTAIPSSPSLLDRIKEMGADDYLIKPFDPVELLKKVKRFIG